MKITVNGQEKHFDNLSNLKTLVQSVSRDPEHVITEVNGFIIKKDQWEQMVLKDGDTVELVTLVGGG